ncbi:homeobox protein prophet of Pit-1-like [Xyrichtys novacula]|uniref:Homeobox protein prophet of Pit-1-like n=1 Tax=Xyrichtys novacula TaxID=13765 RepID=A0AAV1FZ51_XYRNO|nr:homeobox protein prophet of Pit-1-like [Xyrichtys novacula]
MDRSTVTDFSIDRILSSQLGLKPTGKDRSPGGYLQEIPGGRSLDYAGNFTAPVPVPVPVPVPGCLHYRGMGFGEALYPYGGGYQHTEYTGFYPNPGVYLHFNPQHPTDAHPLSGYHDYHQAAVSAQPQSRQKSRMRTVFTDSQAKQLETLFELTDYPTVEARAQVARLTGLSEETVRVWFKNRRARRKRQRSGSKVKSPSPPPSPGAERKIFSSFL